MSDSQDDSDIMKDLNDLFAWNPPPFKLATIQSGGCHSKKTRDPAWYDLHLAESRICKKLAYVKDLHKRIAHVVDKKLQKIRDDGITLQPPTAEDYTNRLDTKRTLNKTGQ